MEIFFDLDDIIEFPEKISIRNVDDLFLIIAYEIPTWITLNRLEFFLFQSLRKGLSIKESLIESIYQCGIDEIEARNLMYSLLLKIEESKFYKNTKPIIEDEPINIEKNIHVYLTHKCNLTCPYCYVSAGNPLEDELSWKEWLFAFERLKEVAPNAEITFSGGEPLTKKGFFYIVEHTFNLGYKNVLFTNGTLINEDNIVKLKKFISLIQISLDGLSPEINDLTRGKNSFEKILKAIYLIRENDIPLDIAINITPYNLDNICNGLIKFIEDLSYEKLNVRLNFEMDKEGFAINLEDSFFNIYELNKEKLKNLVLSLINKGYYSIREKSKLRRLKNCGIGLSFGIDSNGDIYPCDKLYNSYGNIINSNLKDIANIFSNLNKITEIDNIEFCQSCDLKYICNGGCKINNIINTGSYLLPNCDEKYKKRFYEKLVYGF